jgi:hypothetical protein
MPQPAYRPLNDFFPFGFLQQKLQGIHFPDRESLKSTICQIFHEIDRDVLVSVLLDYIERLKWVIENDGEYCNRRIKIMKKSLRGSEKYRYRNFVTGCNFAIVAIS